MSKNERLQILLSAEQKLKLEAKAKRSGFDSASDSVRFLINSFVNDTINVFVETELVEIASPELEKEIGEALAEVAAGKTITLDPRDKDFHKKMIDFANNRKKSKVHK